MRSILKAPAGIIAILVFLLCMLILWVTQKGEMNTVIMAVSGIYGIICFSFLLFQLYAFVWAHTHYDEDVENIKYQVFEAENEEIPKS